jgi:hypothetical protein
MPAQQVFNAQDHRRGWGREREREREKERERERERERENENETLAVVLAMASESRGGGASAACTSSAEGPSPSSFITPLWHQTQTYRCAHRQLVQAEEWVRLRNSDSQTSSGPRTELVLPKMKERDQSYRERSFPESSLP